MYRDYKSAMAPQIKLTYFNARGRGEITRLCLAAGGVKYEDNRIEFADWPALKEKTPYGGLPLLEVDGAPYGQGIAIAAYAATLAGCYGSSPEEKLKIDSIALYREDVLIETTKWFFEADEKKKEEASKKLFGETFPKFLDTLTKFLKENPKNSGFIVGSKMSLADLVFVEGVQGMYEQDEKCLDGHPDLKKLREKVVSSKGIKEYLAKRPKTDF